jgi:peptidoglycan DL-endopeptidase LytE
MKKQLLIPFLALSLFLSTGTIAKGQHWVEKGDTMYKIARQNGMSVKDLISLNPQHLDPNKIHIGDYIITRNPVEKQKDLVDYARSLQDVTAYKYGGDNPPLVTDCSGWVQSIFKKFGVQLPRTSREQAKVGLPVAFKELVIGDLMFFSTRVDKSITHVGIYMGENFWISNLNSEKSVEILSTWGAWTQKYFLYGTRIKI